MSTIKKTLSSKSFSRDEWFFWFEEAMKFKREDDLNELTGMEYWSWVCERILQTSRFLKDYAVGYWWILERIQKESNLNEDQKQECWYLQSVILSQISSNAGGINKEDREEFEQWLKVWKKNPQEWMETLHQWHQKTVRWRHHPHCKKSFDALVWRINESCRGVPNPLRLNSYESLSLSWDDWEWIHRDSHAMWRLREPLDKCLFSRSQRERLSIAGGECWVAVLRQGDVRELELLLNKWGLCDSWIRQWEQQDSWKKWAQSILYCWKKDRGVNVRDEEVAQWVVEVWKRLEARGVLMDRNVREWEREPNKGSMYAFDGDLWGVIQEQWNAYREQQQFQKILNKKTQKNKKSKSQQKIKGEGEGIKFESKESLRSRRL